jgi:hypothetical protein
MFDNKIIEAITLSSQAHHLNCMLAICEIFDFVKDANARFENTIINFNKEEDGTVSLYNNTQLIVNLDFSFRTKEDIAKLRLLLIYLDKL